MYKNRVDIRDSFLYISLTQGKIAIADNDEHVKKILQKHRFHAIKRISGGQEVFYALSRLERSRTYLHRIVLGEQIEGKCVYHLDGNTLNCCRSNLAVKTNIEMLREGLQLRPLLKRGIYKIPYGWLVAWKDEEGNDHRKKFCSRFCEPKVVYERALKFKQSQEQKNNK